MKENGKNGNGEATKIDIFLQDPSLDEIDVQIITMRIEKPGIRQAELEIATGLTRQTLWDRSRKPAYKKALAQSREMAIEIIESAKKRAAERLAELVEATSEAVARQSCADILADVLPSRRMEITGGIMHHHFDHGNAVENLIDKLDKIQNGELGSQRN